VLKHYGSLTLFEQNNMTAEDRSWWVKRLNKAAEDSKKNARG